MIKSIDTLLERNNLTARERALLNIRNPFLIDREDEDALHSAELYLINEYWRASEKETRLFQDYMNAWKEFQILTIQIENQALRLRLSIERIQHLLFHFESWGLQDLEKLVGEEAGFSDVVSYTPNINETNIGQYRFLGYVIKKIEQENFVEKCGVFSEYEKYLEKISDVFQDDMSIFVNNNSQKIQEALNMLKVVFMCVAKRLGKEFYEDEELAPITAYIYEDLIPDIKSIETRDDELIQQFDMTMKGILGERWSASV